MQLFYTFLLVGAGGALGSALRFAIQKIVAPFSTLPLSTFVVNIVGSFCIGVFSAILLKNNSDVENQKAFLITGICGGFTTFSTFSADNVQLLRDEKYGWLFVYIIASVLLGVGATLLGYKLFK